MRRVIAYVAIAILLVSSLLVIALFYSNNPRNAEQKPFYVGIAYTGNTTAGAKLLIDRVKNYTNLFVLQSGQLQEDLTATLEICDYAVDSGLNIIVYFGSYASNRDVVTSFLNVTGNRWGDHFLGLYYGDEPGGKMLDSQVDFHDEETGDVITKTLGGDVRLRFARLNGTQIDFYKSGVITVFDSSFDVVTQELEYSMINYQTNGTIVKSTLDGTTTFYPNGTVTFMSPNGPTQIVTDQGDISQFESYGKLWGSRPLQTYDEAAERFLAEHKNSVEWLRNQSSSKVFTSDYGLYWFDFQCGYDVVLAQFGWNRTTTLDIGLVRGGANLQSKSWGAMITWKYDVPPYLGSGEEMYRQMQMAYENGAEYVVVFNYPAIEGNSYGVLTDEHFDALERFWKDVVPESKVAKSGVKAEAVLLLPKNYGWGMRSQTDTIWGLFPADSKSSQIWTVLQDRLAMHGSLLDVAYDDPRYPISAKYPKIYYWNQTS